LELRPDNTSKLIELCEHDRNIFLQGEPELLIGVDEVGRGALAGPVVCAGFSSKEFYQINKEKLIEETRLHKLNDSKQVKFSDREVLVNALKDTLEGTFYAISEKPASYIDEYGIVSAIFQSMSESISKILLQFYQIHNYYPKTITILVDGPKIIPALDEFLENYFTKACLKTRPQIKQIAIKKGDSLSASIAAASNIAKDYRDKLMRNLIKQNPELEVYGWQTNVGYGSLAHRQAIQSKHLSIYHRRSFCRSILPN